MTTSVKATTLLNYYFASNANTPSHWLQFNICEPASLGVLKIRGNLS